MPKIHKIGNSFKITIPPAILKAIGWSEHEEVEIKISGKSLVITPKKP